MILITSSILSNFSDIKLFMSGKEGGVSPSPYCLNLSFSVDDKVDNVRKNRDIFFNSIGIKEEELAIQKQIHSNNVQIISKPGIYSDCDALITDKKDVFLSVTIADCVPIFLYDNIKKVIAVVHSGWKGTANKILMDTLHLMSDKFSCKPGDIYAFIGPSASGCCYEIDYGVSKHFESSFLTSSGENKYKVDLKKVNQAQLRDFNIPEKNVEVSQFCTICNPILFHSYRRDGKKSGRMLGIFGMI